MTPDRRAFAVAAMSLLVPAVPADRSRTIRLFLCGDVMTGRGVDQILPHPVPPGLHESWVHSAEDYVRLAERVSGPIRRTASFDYIWGEALEAWRRAAPDARLINLETSITRSEDYRPKGINSRMSPENIGCLLAARIDCCELANNHVLDWGQAGLLDTLQTLKRSGIKTVGAGPDLASARAPAVIDLAGKGRVLVISMGAPSSGVPRDWAAAPARPGVNFTDLTKLDVQAVREALAPVRRPGDIVVVSVHWGANWGYEVADAQRRFAHALIDKAGAAIVHGHSSHHPKAIEVHNGRLILYGCGDFIDDYEGIEGQEAYRGDLALMYFADVDPRSGALIRLTLTPLRIRQLRLHAASTEEVAWLQARLDRECARFGGGIEPSAEGLVLKWSRPVA
jgi:poly-gamma-glutamate capsule biosynthesis protein CapA/YwtB (metallophosphatase superfamily)